MSESNVTLLERLSWVCNVVFHQALAVVFVYILTLAFANLEIDSYLTWHIVLTTIGYVLLMLEALILFMKPNVFTLHLSRTTKYTIHACLMGLASICITIGIALIISQKSKWKSNHFNTDHGRLGLSSLVLLWVTACGGVMARYSQVFSKLVKGKWMKLGHYFMGIVALTLGITTLGFGLNQEVFALVARKNIVTGVITVIGLLAGWSLVDACNSIVNRILSK